MSLQSILSVATTALRTHTEDLNVVGHNLANAGTEGYSRQRLVTSARDPLVTPDGVFGTGVGSLDVEQFRDRQVDSQFRRAAGLQAHADGRSNTLTRIEVLMNEPSDLGVSSQLDRFFSSFSDLATNPSSTAARNVVISEGMELTNRIGNLAAELDVLRLDVESAANADLDRANDLLRQIGDMNNQVVAAEAGARTAGDLRDQRNLMIDELSTLVPVTVVEQDSGAVGILAEGVLLMDGNRFNELEIRDNAGTLEVGVVGRTTVIDSSSGSIGGRLESLNTDLPALTAGLDALANDLVTSVNAIYSTGMSPDGSTALNFFDPTGTAAASFSLDAAITGPGRVVAGVASATPAYQAGENSIALQIAQLRDTAGGLGDTPGNYYRDVVTDMGRRSASSQDTATVQGALAQNANAVRLSTSGVSIDEELVDLIQIQTAYQAAARIIGTVDEMMATLVNI